MDERTIRRIVREELERALHRPHTAPEALEPPRDYLTGACVAVGEGKLKAGRAVELLRGRAHRGVQGLAREGARLDRGRYPDDAEVGLRAEQARARRDAS